MGLEVIQCLIGSQCSSLKIGVMWLDFVPLVHMLVVMGLGNLMFFCILNFDLYLTLAPSPILSSESTEFGHFGSNSNEICYKCKDLLSILNHENVLLRFVSRKITGN